MFGTQGRNKMLQKLSTTLDSVGPGSYDLRTLMGEEGRKNSISPKCILDFRDKESRNMPGPGYYEN